MTYIKSDHPYKPKSNDVWSDTFVVPVLDRSAAIAQKLKLPAVTREISLFAMMQECPAIIDQLEALGVKGKKLYHRLVFQYALYDRNGFNKNHMPEDMEASFRQDQENYDDDDKDPVLDLIKESQKQHQDGFKMSIDSDIDVGSILLEVGNDIAVLEEAAPDSVNQETYDEYAFYCFVQAVDQACVEPVGYCSIYGLTSLVAEHLCHSDDDNYYDPLPVLLDVLYPPPEDVGSAYDANKEDISSKEKKGKNKDNKKDKKKNPDTNALLGGDESVEGSNGGPSSPKPS